MTTAREALTHVHDKMVVFQMEHVVGTQVTTEEMFKIQNEKFDTLFTAVLDLGLILVKIEESPNFRKLLG